MSEALTGCLVLGCGNTLRGDDGVGPALCAWAERRFASEEGVRVIARQQWTPELAQDLAGSEAVVFVDSSLDSAAGVVKLEDILRSSSAGDLGAHHLGPGPLLALAQQLYGSGPRRSMLLTVGAGSCELRESFSLKVEAALGSAQRMLELAVNACLKKKTAQAARVLHTS